MLGEEVREETGAGGDGGGGGGGGLAKHTPAVDFFKRKLDHPLSKS